MTGPSFEPRHGAGPAAFDRTRKAHNPDISQGPLRVSVIIPAHNAAPFIAETLRSVLGQSYPADEVIVVDDGSDDGTCDVIRKGFPSEPRVRVLTSTVASGGPSAPRNRGVRVAEGDLIVLLDADDLLARDALHWLVQFFGAAPSAGAAFFNIDLLDETANSNMGPFLAEHESFWRLHRRQVAPWSYLIEDPGAYRQLIETNFVRTAGTGIPRHVFDEVGFFDEGLVNSEDLDLWLRILKRYPLGFIDRPGAYYRVRAGSVSADAWASRDRIRALHKHLATETDPRTKRTISRKLAINHAHLGYELRTRGEFDQAERHYRTSLRYRPTWFALKGLILTRARWTKRQDPASRRSGSRS